MRVDRVSERVRARKDSKVVFVGEGIARKECANQHTLLRTHLNTTFTRFQQRTSLEKQTTRAEWANWRNGRAFLENEQQEKC